MKPERWGRVRELFTEALSRPEEERMAYLLDACGSDEALLEEASRLLEAQRGASGFLEPLRIDDLDRPHWAPEELLGTRLGDFELLEEIGRGAMGVVYRARQESLGRDVALKVMPPSQGMGADRASRFELEAVTAGRLEHPNIVRVLSAGEAERLQFIAMELVVGPTLREWLAAGPTLDELLAVFAAAGRGLAAAHDRGFTHRDFKPDNVLVSEDGRVVVTDFGLARHRSSSQSDDVTREGAIVGTPAYMAPEVRSGGEVDARSDQFGFAVALYHALHGHLPRVDLPLMRGARRHELSWRLRRLLRRALAGDPADRFPSMQALVVELERCRTRSRATAALAVAAAVGALAVTFAVTHDRPSARLSPAWSSLAAPSVGVVEPEPEPEPEPGPEPTAEPEPAREAGRRLDEPAGRVPPSRPADPLDKF